MDVNIELEQPLYRGGHAHANLILKKDVKIKTIDVRLVGLEKTAIETAEIYKIEEKIEINDNDFNDKYPKNGNNNTDNSTTRTIPFKIPISPDIKKSCQGRFFSFQWKIDFILNRSFMKDIHLETVVEIV
jgi:hypothetical protein